jgi:hypothetical protein
VQAPSKGRPSSDFKKSFVCITGEKMTGWGVEESPESRAIADIAEIGNPEPLYH